MKSATSSQVPKMYNEVQNHCFFPHQSGCNMDHFSSCRSKKSRSSLLGTPRFDMSQLTLATTVSALAGVSLACSLKVSFPSNHNPKYFRAVQSLIYSPFMQKEVGLNQWWCVNSTAFVFVVTRLSLADSIQWVIAWRALFAFHSSMGISSSAVTTRVLSA